MKKTSRKNTVKIARTCDDLVLHAWNLAAAEKQRIGFICLSMSNHELVNRLIAKGSQLPTDKILNGNLTSEEWHLMSSVIEILKEASIYVDDTLGKTYQQRIEGIRQMVKENEVSTIFIDSLKLLFSDMGTLTNEENAIRTLLIQLSEELNIKIEACL